jgi:hypothetical protein
VTGLFRGARWERSVRKHFDFLVREFGFEFRGVDGSMNYLTRASYVSRTTEVDVDDSDEFRRVEVLLIRLVDGAAPPYPIFISNTPVLHHFSLDTVLARRAPDLLARIDPVASYKGGNVDQALRAWADALRAHASDILQGDFGLFPELEAELREKVRQSPQRIEVFVPSGRDVTSAEMNKLTRTFPSIPIVVAKYAQPPRRSPSGLRALIRRLFGV